MILFNPRTAPLRFAARPQAILHYLGQILLVSAVLMLAPLFVALISDAIDVTVRYLIACAALGIVGWRSARLPEPRILQKNEALCIAGLTFLLSSCAIAIPMTGYGLSALDAWFEAVSAVTTTGLSTLDSVERLPFSFHFGRSWAQWIGGLGVVVLSLAFLLQPGAAVRHLGFDPREADDVVGGTRRHARLILTAYGGITLLSVLLIWAAGTPIGEALTDGLAAVSTGGFATRDASLAGLPPLSIAAVTFASMLGAIPFYLYYRQAYSGWRRVIADPQLLTLAAISLIGVLAVYVLAAVHRHDAGLATLGESAAMALSAQTTAGFSVAPVASLGPGATLVLCAAMFVGGGLGSTAGGIKVLRLIILYRLFQLILLRASVSEHTYLRLRLGWTPLRQPEVEAALGIIIAYMGAISLSWFVFVSAGYEPMAALFEVTSAVATSGLSAGITGSDLPAALKIVLCIDMLLGRVETLAIVILLFPVTWIGNRRRI